MVENINTIVKPLVDILGVKWTAIVIICIVLIIYWFKNMQDEREFLGFKLALKEKDDTIERMRNELSGYQQIVFKRLGMTSKDIDRLFNKNMRKK